MRHYNVWNECGLEYDEGYNPQAYVEVPIFIIAAMSKHVEQLEGEVMALEEELKELRVYHEALKGKTDKGKKSFLLAALRKSEVDRKNDLMNHKVQLHKFKEELKEARDRTAELTKKLGEAEDGSKIKDQRIVQLAQEIRVVREQAAEHSELADNATQKLGAMVLKLERLEAELALLRPQRSATPGVRVIDTGEDNGLLH